MNTPTPVRFDFRALGKPCSLQLEGEDTRKLRRAAWLAITEIQRIELKYAAYQAHSVICRINARAGAAAMAVDAETLALLAFVDGLWHQSNGLFDITCGVLRRAWDFQLARVPHVDELQRLLRLIGWQRVEIHGGQVRLPQPGMALDLGGVLKAYAADSAAALLQGHGVQQALVQVGSCLHAVGPRRGPAQAVHPWPVPIPHPRPLPDSADGPLATWNLTQDALAICGRRDAGFEHQGHHYGPLLNPRTGWPVQQVAQVTVAARRATAAWATAAIARLQGDQALDWLDEQETPYLLVDAAGTAHHSTRRRQAPAPFCSTALKGTFL